ncbi:TATA binding protein (TBP)-interacting protein (TIP49) [Ignicoccus pacificus DSM 13166]|uniref:DNA helicase n=1 Tax=Ignicoccus pacificus DSM 13166 TaxID=940294 RepID=A0A977PKN0_9CREN|nr:TATA binding protein (TBP)-interacting protein (TIP49) [Ignicoccus pacificus DSM 13166]
MSIVAKIEELPKVQRETRVGFHTHIKGLGLDEKGKAKKVADGLVGQEEAREALGIVANMIKEGRMAGRGLLIVGPPGTGKTALAIALAKELGEDTPFVAVGGSEIMGSPRKSEVLMQAMRRAIGVRIKEKRRVYEGAVKELRFRMVRHPYNPYVKVPREAIITLETAEDEQTLTVDEDIAYQLLQLGVRKGDVIAIDADTGRVYRIGRVKKEKKGGITLIKEINLPEGPVLKEKEVVHTLTLHDLDTYYAAQQAPLSLLAGFGPESVTDEARKQVDKTVSEWLKEGKAELVPGVLFIDDAHLLDLEAFSFLSRAMEKEFAPIIVLATNRGKAKIRGTDEEAPHGIPLDMLDRLLIIKTRPYTRDEIEEIVKIRAKEEGVKLTEEAVKKLGEIGEQRSLRYAIHLMQPAKVIAEREGREEVEAKDVEEAEKKFVDVKDSVKYVEEFKDKFL